MCIVACRGACVCVCIPPSGFSVAYTYRAAFDEETIQTCLHEHTIFLPHSLVKIQRLLRITNHRELSLLIDIAKGKVVEDAES